MKRSTTMEYEVTYDSYWTLPGVPGTRPGLPDEQIEGQPIPTTWNMVGPDRARELGAVLHRRERVPRFYSVPEGVDPWTTEQRDGVCLYRLDREKLVHDAAGEKRELALSARGRRDRLLAQSDWTHMPDAPLDDAVRSLWAEYRQLLRDLPLQEGFPQRIAWPEMVG
jgi:hypothetical protein